MMYPPKPLFTKVLMGALTVALASGAVFGNGSILAVIARFQSFRTVPNTLIANLAVVDLLNAFINMPSHMLYTILEVSWFKGQSLAIITSFFNRLFIILNLASMLALMANMYFAIAFDLKYFAWKSNKKAVVCSFLIWFIGTLVVVLFSLPLLSIDLGDAHVIEYRAEIYKQGKQYVAVFMVVFIICGAVLGFLMICSIKKKKQKRAVLNLLALQAQARLQSDINATKTIAITIAAYFFSYVPAITYAAVGQKEESLTDSWFGFLAWYAIFFSSAVNPVIYYLRSSRFRSAFKQFLNDPFGSGKFKEKRSSRGKGREERSHLRVDSTKKKNNEDTSGSQTDGRPARQEYHGKRRNGMTIFSIQLLQVHLYVLEDGKTDLGGRPIKQRKNQDLSFTSAALSQPINLGLLPLAQLAIEARKTYEQKLLEAQKPGEPKIEQAGKKRRVKDESTREQRKRPSSRMKVYPLGEYPRAEDLTQCQENNAKIQEKLESTQNAMTLVEGKQAWGGLEVIDIDEEDKTMTVIEEFHNEEELWSQAHSKYEDSKSSLRPPLK